MPATRTTRQTAARQAWLTVSDSDPVFTATIPTAPNDPSRFGEAASRPYRFGFGSRFKLVALHTTGTAVLWALFDQNALDPFTGEARRVATGATRAEALAGLR